MKKENIFSMIIQLIGALLLCTSLSYAATDGIYNLTQVNPAWDGTDARRLQIPTTNYDYTYGDEESLGYSLPWTFTFYGAAYNHINVDTNGNIWFSYNNSTSSFNLPSANHGPVISAWNNDLSSYYYAGVFVQHKTNPERLVVEWQTETQTNEGNYLPNNFETVLYPNGNVRFDYRSFAASAPRDFGSGISKDDNLHYLNMTANYGPVYYLAGYSYGFFPVANGLSVPEAPRTVTATGGNAQATVLFYPPIYDGGSSITGYTVSSIPAGGVDTNAGTTLTSHVVTGLTNGAAYAFTVTATNSIGTGPASAPSNPVTPAAPAQHTLAVAKLGLGTISSYPAGISCGGACSALFNLSTSVTITAMPSPGWNFVGWAGACTGIGQCTVTMDSDKVVRARFAAPVEVGVFRNETWYLDSNGNRAWDGMPTDTLIAGFNPPVTNGIPVVGDWNGSGSTMIGIYDPATAKWYLDLDGNGVWNATTDAVYWFGFAGVTPVTGDWNGDGRAKIGVYDPASATWYLDFNGNGTWDGVAIDKSYYFGFAGAVPVMGDWNGDGSMKIGVYDPTSATWYLDFNGNGVWDGITIDKSFYFGFAGIQPVTGDWNGDGRTKIGAYDPASFTWYLDYDGNGAWNGVPPDSTAFFGIVGSRPVTGKW